MESEKNEACPSTGLPAEPVCNNPQECDPARDLHNTVATCHLGEVEPKGSEARETKQHEIQGSETEGTGQHERVRLWDDLQKELGPAFADLRFLHIFRQELSFSSYRPDKEDWQRYREKIHDMVPVYQGMLGSKTAPAVPPPEEVAEIHRTFLDIKFLAAAYIKSQLRWFGGGEDPAATAPASRTEEQRVARAFIRYLIIEHAWAWEFRENEALYSEDRVTIGNTTEKTGHRLGLYAAFEPWELQHVDHISYFLSRVYPMLRCEEAKEKEGEGQGQALGDGPDYEEVKIILAHEDRLVQRMREHPDTTERALVALRLPDYGTKEKPDEESPQYSYYSRMDRFSPHFLGLVFQRNRLAELPDEDRDRDFLVSLANHREVMGKLEKEGRVEEKINFVGDAVNQPPFGWVDMLDGERMNGFGHWLNTVFSEGRHQTLAKQPTMELWRSSGFALWDQERVRALKKLPRFTGLHTGFILRDGAQ